MENFIALQLATPAISVALLGPVVLYLVARWRAHREPQADPQLGFKFVLHYFSTIAFHTALAGATLLLYTMIRPGGDDGERLRAFGERIADTSWKSPYYRAAFGFLVPAAIVFAGSLLALARTNDAQHTGVRKLFTGFNLLITGLVGFAALVLGFQALFAKSSTDGMGHLGGSAILVYCSAWAVLGYRMYTMVLGNDRTWGSQDPPDIVPPPGPPPEIPPAASSSGGLPSLGGGSFPPIDKR